MNDVDDVDLVALTSVTSILAASVSSIESDQWRSATPCAEWTVTALIDHITGGNWFTLAVLAGKQAKDAIAATVRLFGDTSATCEVAVQSLKDQAYAFCRPRVLDQTWNHIAGDISGRQILRLRLHDLIVHSWDVQETLPPGAALASDLVQWGFDHLCREDPLAVKHFQLASPAAARLPSDGAAGYLRLFGR